MSMGRPAGATSQYKHNWEIHGFLGILAWGVFVPCAVQAALMRGTLKKEGGFGSNHRTINIIAYILSVTAVAMAVYYINKESAPRFNGVHEKAGLIGWWVIVSKKKQYSHSGGVKKGSLRNV